MVRQHQTRNLEIPGLVLRAPRNDGRYSMIAIRRISMTSEVMAFGLCPRAANALSLDRARRRMHWHVPDFLGIFADRAIG